MPMLPALLRVAVFPLRMAFLQLTILLVIGWFFPPIVRADSEHWSEGLDSVMYDDPHFEFPDVIMWFSPSVKPLWRAALNDREADLKQHAATTIVWARRRGMEDLQEMVAPLTRNLTENSRRVVRLASAEALVALDARDSADALFRRSQLDGLDMAQTVEPALGRWRVPAIRDAWRARLRDPSVDRRRMLIAIRGLGEMDDKRALPDLERIADDGSQLPEIRLAAGDAAGLLSPQGQEARATELADRQSQAGPVDSLLAAKLLRWHSSQEARTLLIRLARHDQSSVAVIALSRLLELDPGLILPIAESRLAKGDVNVRRVVAEALIARPSETTVTQLGKLLADPNPDLRIFVRRSMVTLAESSELRPLIIEQGEQMLDDDRWQPLEQSMKLLVSLEHKGQTRRFIDLLAHSRTEILVTAAWALRKSAVDETLEPLLEFAKQRNGKRKEILGQDLSGRGLDEQLAQILQFFGQKKYTPAEPFLRTFVPKDFDLEETRGAAIWALGYLHEGKPDAELVADLEERMKDITGMFPELMIVRRFSAISLGRMQARDALPTLEAFGAHIRIEGDVDYACAWSIQQITGQTFEPPVAAKHMYSDFFIEPLPTKK